MKKFLKRCMLVLLAVVGTFAFSGCLDDDDNGGGSSTHTHTWASSWSSDSTHHWHKCTGTGCSEKSGKTNHTITDDVCTVCGYDVGHTHTWSSEYQKNDTQHWKVCTGCSEEKSRANHTYSGNTCTTCGHTKQADNPGGNNGGDNGGNNGGQNVDTIASIRDLEIVTIRTAKGGFATLVKLPDGKNMLIDSGADDLTAEIEVDDMLLAAQIETLDYFVTTCSTYYKTGAADLVFDYYQVNNFYKPEISSNVTPTDSYLTAVQKAEAEPNCTVKTIGESNCDISYTFKDNKNAYYTYEIDFMIPVAAASATNVYDNSVVISIKYKDKVVLITNDATNKTIDAYCTKYGNQKDVDVLITSYLPSEQYAITSSANRGTDFLGKINLESTDYAVIVPLSNGSAVNTLENKLASICGQSDMHSLSTSRGLTTAVTKITSSGAVSVTSR